MTVNIISHCLTLSLVQVKALLLGFTGFRLGQMGDWHLQENDYNVVNGDCSLLSQFGLNWILCTLKHFGLDWIIYKNMNTHYYKNMSTLVWKRKDLIPLYLLSLQEVGNDGPSQFSSFVALNKPCLCCYLL